MRYRNQIIQLKIMLYLRILSCASSILSLNKKVKSVFLLRRIGRDSLLGRNTPEHVTCDWWVGEAVVYLRPHSIIFAVPPLQVPLPSGAIRRSAVMVVQSTFINDDVRLQLVASWRFVVRGNGLSVNLGQRWGRKSLENGRIWCWRVSRIRCVIGDAPT